MTGGFAVIQEGLDQGKGSGSHEKLLNPESVLK